MCILYTVLYTHTYISKAGYKVSSFPKEVGLTVTGALLCKPINLLDKKIIIVSKLMIVYDVTTLLFNKMVY